MSTSDNQLDAPGSSGSLGRSGNLGAVTSERVPFGVAVLGGPTTVIDIAGQRVVCDPTFDPPGDYGYLRKLEGPAVAAADLGSVSVVLVSHDQHADNLDTTGREFALAAPALLTTPTSAARLGEPARGLATWETWTSATGSLTVTAVPARHGPADGEVDEDGFVNCAVTGFLLETRGPSSGPTVYVSGDNASLEHVREVREHLRARDGRVDWAVLFAGAASVPVKFQGRPLSLTASRAAAAAEVLDARHVVVAHQTGWAHFAEGPDHTRAAFEEAGIAARLCATPAGRWCHGDPVSPA